MSEWTTVVSKNSKKSRKSKSSKKHIQSSTYNFSTSSIKPRFVFQGEDKTKIQEKQTKSITKTVFPELKQKQQKNRPRFEYHEQDVTSVQPKKKENIWSSIVCKSHQETPKKETSLSVEKNETKKQNKFTIYLYDREVNKLLREMKWGDFECMMDDVIIIPNNQPKPNTN